MRITRAIVIESWLGWWGVSAPRSSGFASCGVFPAPTVTARTHRMRCSSTTNPKEKRFALTTGRALLKSREDLLAEIAKCDIVCTNRHRLRTAAQHADGTLQCGFKPSVTPAASRDGQARRERFLRLRAAQLEVLDRVRALPCLDCGRTLTVAAMEFDHLVPGAKRGELSYLAGRVRIGSLLEELAKCDIVCANCHAERTYHRRTCREAGCSRVWCSGTHAILPRLKGGFDPRYPLSGPGQPWLIKESMRLYAA